MALGIVRQSGQKQQNILREEVIISEASSLLKRCGKNVTQSFIHLISFAFIVQRILNGQRQRADEYHRHDKGVEESVMHNCMAETANSEEENYLQVINGRDVLFYFVYHLSLSRLFINGYKHGNLQ